MSKEKGQGLIEALRELLSEGSAKNQDTLKRSLNSQGFEVNQSKISRLLRKLGAIKTTGGSGEVVYQLPFEAEPPSRKTTVHHLVEEILRNEIMVVIRTSPGSASLIARVLDYNMEKIVSIGSVAGDDTIFVVPKSVQSIEETFRAIKKLLAE